MYKIPYEAPYYVKWIYANFLKKKKKTSLDWDSSQKLPENKIKEVPDGKLTFLLYLCK